MEFIELSTFEESAALYLSEDEILRLQIVLKNDPDKGVLVPGTRGLRKLRWKAKGRGKRGGLRIIYYWQIKDLITYLIYVYKKSNKDDLTIKELNLLRNLI